jgi:hypothetical protein
MVPSCRSVVKAPAVDLIIPDFRCRIPGSRRNLHCAIGLQPSYGRKPTQLLWRNGLLQLNCRD